MSSLFKQLYRYTRPRSYRHNENLWPWARIDRRATGEIASLRYKGQSVPLVALSDLQGSYRGDVLLTATGPSVNSIDFSRLPPMTTLGVNGAYSLEDRRRFDLYIIVDMGFIDRKSALIARIIANRQLLLFTTLHGIARLIDRFGLAAIQCRLVLIEDACYRIYQPAIATGEMAEHLQQDSRYVFSTPHPEIAFSRDIRAGIVDAGTVVYWALQILLFLGFSRFYIAGLDMTHFHQPRFYETEQDKLPSFLEEKFDTLIVPAFSLAGDILRQRGIEVINLSVNSALGDSIFKKVSYHDAFQV